MFNGKKRNIILINLRVENLILVKEATKKHNGAGLGSKDLNKAQDLSGVDGHRLMFGVCVVELLNPLKFWILIFPQKIRFILSSTKKREPCLRR